MNCSIVTIPKCLQIYRYIYISRTYGYDAFKNEIELKGIDYVIVESILDNRLR